MALRFLESSGTGADLPSLILTLKKRFPGALPKHLSLAAEMYAARRQAPAKLGAWASQGYFSLAVLQQASRACVAAARARHFAGCRHVLEIGTGSACDTAALARVSGHVTSIECDEATAILARRNLELLGVANATVLVGDAQTLVPAALERCDALFADPARRTPEGERIFRPEDYSPPLSWVMELPVRGIRAIKISPGLFVEPPPGWARQFVGVGAECLEQTLWHGAAVDDSSVLLADLGVEWGARPLQPALPAAEELRGYLCEAHGAVNRSQRLAEFFAEHGVRRVADDVAYGISPGAPGRSPLISAFRIISEGPLKVSDLRASLVRLGWSNRTEIKKRSVNVDPEQLRRELSLREHSHEAEFGVVFLFPWRGKPWCVLCERECD